MSLSSLPMPKKYKLFIFTPNVRNFFARVIFLFALLLATQFIF